MVTYSNASVTDLLALNPALGIIKIRVDAKTQQASVLDVIRLVTGKNAPHAAKYFERLDDMYKTKCAKVRINGKGRPTPVASAPVLVEIIWELPGKTARDFRRISAHYVSRILGGDRSLIKEIELRYERGTPAQRQFFLQNADRRGMAQSAPTPAEQEAILRRKRQEVEMMQAELNLQERRAALQQREVEHKLVIAERRLQLKQGTMQWLANTEATMNRIFQNDAHLKAAFKDAVMRELDVRDQSSVSDYVEISTVLREMGRGAVIANSTLSKVGKAVAKEFRRRYPGQRIPQVQKYVNGSMRQVKAYRKAHLPMIRAVVASMQL